MPQLYGREALLLGLPYSPEGGRQIMSMDRREFLKIAGISSLLGLGATAASATHNVWVKGIQPPQVEPNKEALTAKHWSMVVDMSKFKTDEDIKKVVSACHTTHNVPDFGNI